MKIKDILSNDEIFELQKNQGKSTDEILQIARDRYKEQLASGEIARKEQAKLEYQKRNDLNAIKELNALKKEAIDKGASGAEIEQLQNNYNIMRHGTPEQKKQLEQAQNAVKIKQEIIDEAARNDEKYGGFSGGASRNLQKAWGNTLVGIGEAAKYLGIDSERLNRGTDYYKNAVEYLNNIDKSRQKQGLKTFSEHAGNFVGAIGGPVEVATLPFGFGKTALRTAGKFAGIELLGGTPRRIGESVTEPNSNLSFLEKSALESGLAGGFGGLLHGGYNLYKGLKGAKGAGRAETAPNTAPNGGVSGTTTPQNSNADDLATNGSWLGDGSTPPPSGGLVRGDNFVTDPKSANVEQNIVANKNDERVRALSAVSSRKVEQGGGLPNKTIPQHPLNTADDIIDLVADENGVYQVAYNGSSKELAKIATEIAKGEIQSLGAKRLVYIADNIALAAAKDAEQKISANIAKIDDDSVELYANNTVLLGDIAKKYPMLNKDEQIELANKQILANASAELLEYSKFLNGGALPNDARLLGKNAGRMILKSLNAGASKQEIIDMLLKAGISGRNSTAAKALIQTGDINAYNAQMRQGEAELIAELSNKVRVAAKNESLGAILGSAKEKAIKNDELLKKGVGNQGLASAAKKSELIAPKNADEVAGNSRIPSDEVAKVAKNPQGNFEIASYKEKKEILAATPMEQWSKEQKEFFDDMPLFQKDEILEASKIKHDEEVFGKIPYNKLSFRNQIKVIDEAKKSTKGKELQAQYDKLESAKYTAGEDGKYPSGAQLEKITKTQNKITAQRDELINAYIKEYDEKVAGNSRIANDEVAKVAENSRILDKIKALADNEPDQALAKKIKEFSPQEIIRHDPYDKEPITPETYGHYFSTLLFVNRHNYPNDIYKNPILHYELDRFNMELPRQGLSNGKYLNPDDLVRLDDILLYRTLGSEEKIKAYYSDPDLLISGRRKIERAYLVHPIKEFGTNYAEFYHAGGDAVKKLLAEKQGQVAGAFYKDGLGDIDLPWGEVKMANGEITGYGLSKIAEKHSKDFRSFIGDTAEQKMANGIAEIIEKGKVDIDKHGRATIIYDKDGEIFKVGLKQNIFGEKTNNKWVVTSYLDERETQKFINSKGLTERETLRSNSKANSTPKELLSQGQMPAGWMKGATNIGSSAQQPKWANKFKTKMAKMGQEYNDEKIANLANWHKNSHAITKESDGSPKVFYHGTNAKFDAFDIDKGKGSWLGKSFYFTDSKSKAKGYGKNVISTYLNLKNPYISKANDHYSFVNEVKEQFGVKENYGEFDPAQVLKQQGYDGVVYKDWDDEVGTIYTAFSPNQIKSIDNKGTFNPRSKMMRAFSTQALNELMLGLGSGGANAVSEDDPNKKAEAFIKGFLAGFGGAKAVSMLAKNAPKLAPQLARASEKMASDFPRLLNDRPDILGGVLGRMNNAKDKFSFIFGGEKALGANKAKLKVAKDMAKNGAKDDEIWAKTGWYKDIDGKWKFEINAKGGELKELNAPELDEATKIIKRDYFDKQMNLKELEDFIQFKNGYIDFDEIKRFYDLPKDMSKGQLTQKFPYLKMSVNDYMEHGFYKDIDLLHDEIMPARKILNQEYSKTPLNEVLDDPELFASYPQLKDVKVSVDELKSTEKAHFNPSKNEIVLSSRLDAEDMKSSLYHEIQHKVQEIEGFARGGEVGSLNYKKLAGEAEARNVQARQAMLKTADKEAEKIAQMIKDPKKAMAVSRDLANVDDFVRLSHGNYKVGAKHINLRHTSDPKKLGYVTDDEISRLGENMRKFLLKHKEPYLKDNKFVYEWAENGNAYTLVTDSRSLSKPDIFNPTSKTLRAPATDSRSLQLAPFNRVGTPAKDEIITFYSNRNLKTNGAYKFTNPELTWQKATLPNSQLPHPDKTLDIAPNERIVSFDNSAELGMRESFSPELKASYDMRDKLLKSTNEVRASLNEKGKAELEKLAGSKDSKLSRDAQIMKTLENAKSNPARYAKLKKLYLDENGKVKDSIGLC